jgi:hypothetical protein
MLYLAIDQHRKQLTVNLRNDGPSLNSLSYRGHVVGVMSYRGQAGTSHCALQSVKFRPDSDACLTLTPADA